VQEQESGGVAQLHLYNYLWLALAPGQASPAFLAEGHVEERPAVEISYYFSRGHITSEFESGNNKLALATRLHVVLSVQRTCSAGCSHPPQQSPSSTHLCGHGRPVPRLRTRRLYGSHGKLPAYQAPRHRSPINRAGIRRPKHRTRTCNHCRH